MASLEAARDFVLRQGRVLEQRLYATLFEGAPADGVVRAMQAYRNDDGGLGHGLEPDKRCPDSQPLDLQFGLEVLELAGLPATDIPARAADFLAGIADERGAVPFLLPTAREYPNAAHMSSDVFFQPHPWPTSSLAAWLLAFGISHPWVDRATAFALAEIEREPPRDAHAIREAIRLVRHAEADALRPVVVAQLDGADYFLADPDDPEYGLTPLDFEDVEFPHELVEAHLDRLESQQQPDGGWPIRWEPPSDASRLAWRGQRTVLALATLRRHGRL